MLHSSCDLAFTQAKHTRPSRIRIKVFVNMRLLRKICAPMLHKRTCFQKHTRGQQYIKYISPNINPSLYQSGLNRSFTFSRFSHFSLSPNNFDIQITQWISRYIDWLLPFGIVESLPDKNGTESQNLISNFRVEFFSEYNTFGGREMSTTGSATNGSASSSSLSLVETTEATGDCMPSR